MKKLLIILCVVALNIASMRAQELTKFFSEANSFFQDYTSNGNVAYDRLTQNSSHLDALMQMASKITVDTSDEKVYKAFWINAYNLTVIQGIVHNYPLDSPLAVKGFFDAITYKVGGKSLTLNDIENKMLRAKYDEPRFHFVLVCGAKGCPPLISEAYMPTTLEQQLQRQTIKALNDPSFIRVSEGTVALSEIFKWYREDFVKQGLSEHEFLNRYRNNKISTASEITYYPYNWKLNKK
jgi:hypothetical protein